MNVANTITSTKNFSKMAIVSIFLPLSCVLLSSVF